MRPKVAILSLDNVDIHQDSRVLRQISALSQGYEVCVIAYGLPEKTPPLAAKKTWFVGSLSRQRGWRALQTVFFLALGKIITRPAYDLWYWSRPGHRRALSLLVENPVDVIHANDWWTLPVAVKAKEMTGARIVIDLHEYSLEEYSNNPLWRFFYDPVVKSIFDRFSRKADGYITVNQMIASRYQAEYGFSPVVVMNIPGFKTSITSGEVDPDRIRLIHHGAAIRSRQLQTMVQVMPLLDDRFTLTMMLFGDTGYISELKNLADRIAPGRVKFIPPVAPPQIPSVLAGYDLGFYLLPSNEFNYLASLPNKFFEYMAMGMGVIIGPSPEMANMVRRYGFGIASDSFDPVEVAAGLNRLSVEDIKNMKRSALRAGTELNAENEMRKLVGLYSELLSHPGER